MLMAFDIETAADPVVIPWLEPLEAPSNWKDPDKIAAEIARREAKRLEELALDWDYNRIVAIGFTMPDDRPDEMLLVRDTQDEEDALLIFWNAWQMPGVVPVGFRCASFDLPTLIQRSRILDVSVPRIDLKKWGSADFHDLALLLNHNGMAFGHSLNFYCKRFGLDVPADETTGADVAAMVAYGYWDAIGAHCAADVAKTYALAKRVLKGL